MGRCSVLQWIARSSSFSCPYPAFPSFQETFFGLQLQKHSVRWVLAGHPTCACLQGAAPSVLGQLKQVFGKFLSFAFLFPSLYWVLVPFNFMQNWRTLWHNNIKSIAKCSCISAQQLWTMCYYELQGKRMPIVHRLLPCYCECSFLTPWCSLQGRGTLSISLPHLTTFLLHPTLRLSFPCLLHPAVFVPATVCQEGDWTLWLKWSKLKGTPFLRFIFTPDGCSSVVSSTAPSSRYQAVPGRESVSGWIGTSLVALPCRRLSFVELLLPDRGMSKELQGNKSGGSRGLAQWGLEEVVGRVRRMIR